MLCQDCKKKPTCKSLCPKAEKYVRQDYVSQRESPLSEVRSNANASMNMHVDSVFQYISSHSFQELSGYYSADDQTLKFPFLSKLQNKALYMAYYEGLSYRDIAWKLHIREDKLNNQIYSAKQKILKFSSKSEER